MFIRRGPCLLEKNPANADELYLWVEAKPGSGRFIEGTVMLKVKDATYPEYPVRFAGYKLDPPATKTSGE